MLLSFCVAINIKLIAEEGMHKQFSNVGLSINSIIAIVVTVCLILVPCVLIVALDKYWYPAVKEADKYKVEIKEEVFQDKVPS